MPHVESIEEIEWRYNYKRIFQHLSGIIASHVVRAGRVILMPPLEVIRLRDNNLY